MPTNGCTYLKTKIETNLRKLLIKGNRVTRLYGRSLLASSYSHFQCQQLLSNDDSDESTNNQSTMNTKFGRRKFIRYKNLFDEISVGQAIPSNIYRYHVPICKISGAIHFIQQTLQLKPGVLQNVKLDGHYFNNLPIYERGGIPVISLFKMYQLGYDKEHCLGRTTFTDLCTLLTK